MAKHSDVRGVVFQFSEQAVLFEFMSKEGQGEALIGTVHPLKISLNADGKKMKEVSSAEDVARHVQVGDELICDVAKKSGLEKFVYEEEEEEVTEFGDVLNRKNRVEIVPEWLAEEAVLVERSKLLTDAGKNGHEEKQEEDVEDVVELEVPTEDIFEDEEEEVEIPKREETKEEKRDDDLSEFKPRSALKKSANEKKQVEVKKGEARVTKSRAKVVSLKPPVGRTGGRQKVKITSGVMEVTEGPLSGQHAHFQGHVLHFWGQCVGAADLSYHLKAGDMFDVELADTRSESGGSLTVRRAAMGGYDANERGGPAKSPEFLKWMASRGLDLAAFKKWQADGLPRRFYFPLVSEVREGKLVRVLTEKGQVLGGLVELGSLSPPGADVEEDTELVVFKMEDFYAHEVWLGCVDLRMVLRPGDALSVMVSELGGRQIAALRSALSSSEQDRSPKTASLAFVGPRRPRNANMKPNESLGLKEFLSKLGLTPEDVAEKTAEAERRSQSGSNEPSSAPASSAQLIQGHLPFGHNPNPQLNLWQAAGPHPMVVRPQQQPLISTPPPNLQGQMPAAALAHPAISLVSRAIKVSSAEDPKVKELLFSDDDVDYAVFLSKVLTQALLHKMQTDMRSKIMAKHGPAIQPTINAQMLQVKAAAKGIKNVTYPPKKMDAIQQTIAQRAKEIAVMTNAANAAASTPANPGITDIANKFQDMEARMKMQAEMEKMQKAKEQQRSDASKSKMKSMLQAYKATKQGTGGAGAKDDKDLTPIELLRKYHSSGLKPTADGDLLYFGDVSYQRDVKTNFQVTKGGDTRGEPEFYTLGCLAYFLQHLHREHAMYLRYAQQDRMPVVRKQDRNSLLSYLSGNRATVPNLVSKTHRELNPQLSGDRVDDDENEYGGRTSQKRSSVERWGGEPSQKRKSRFDEPAKVGPSFQPRQSSTSQAKPSPWAAAQQQQQQQQVGNQWALQQQQQQVSSTSAFVQQQQITTSKYNLPQQQQQQMWASSSGSSSVANRAIEDLDRAIESERARKAAASMYDSGRRSLESTSSSYDRRAAAEEEARMQERRGRSSDRFDARRAAVDPDRAQYLQSATSSSSSFDLKQSVGGFSSSFNQPTAAPKPAGGRFDVPVKGGRWVSEEPEEQRSADYDPLQPTPSSPSRTAPSSSSWGYSPTPKVVPPAAPSNQQQGSRGFESDLPRAPDAPVLSGFSSSFSFSGSDNSSGGAASGFWPKQASTPSYPSQLPTPYGAPSNPQFGAPAANSSAPYGAHNSGNNVRW